MARQKSSQGQVGGGWSRGLWGASAVGASHTGNYGHGVLQSRCPKEASAAGASHTGNYGHGVTLIYLGFTGAGTIRVFRVHTLTLIYLGFTGVGTIRVF